MSTVTLFSRRTWPSRLGHAVAAFVLTAFVIGVPMALSIGGSPFPAHLPHLSAAWRDLRAGYVPTVVLANVALLAGWCVWAFLSFEIVTEIRAVLRTHTSRHSAALGPLQPLVAKLVAAAVLSLPLITVRPVLRPVAASTVVLSATRPAGRATPTPATSRAADEYVALPTYTVRRGDTLWGIAERYLGNPLRWEEIARLNADRPEEGGEFANPHWIYPGWTLVLPADARGLVEAPSLPARQHAAPPTSDASHRAGTHAAAQSQQNRQVSAPPKPVPLPTSTPSNASTRPNASPRPAPTEHQVSHSSKNEQRSSDRHADNEPGQHPSRAPIAPIGLGILGVGLLGLLVRLRRTQERHRRPGYRIALPTGAAADVERALVAEVDRPLATFVDQAGRLLGEVLHDAENVPTVLGAIVSADSLEYLLDAPAPAPAPFMNSAPDHWRLDRSDPETQDALEPVDDLPSMLPCLVTVGSDDDGVVMLNLESVGSVALVGDDGLASELATALGLELSSAPWTEFVELFDVGIGTGRAAPERCTTVESIDEAIPTLMMRAKEIGQGLEKRGCATLADARRHDSTSWWTPVAIVAAHPSPPSALTSLRPVVAAHDPSVVSIVVGEFNEAVLRLEVNADGSVALPSLGRTVVAHRVSRAHLAGIAALLGLAARRSDATTKAPPYVDLNIADRERVVADVSDRHTDRATSPTSVPRLFDPVAEPTDEAGSDAGQRADADLKRRRVEISVLGPVELTGTERDAERSKSMELIAWLATHRGRGETDTVATALWPTRRDAVRSLWNIITDARRMLGAASDGKPLLERAGDLLLHDEVICDWDRFRHLARNVDPDKWQEALAIVRGRPFGDVDWGWATLDGLAATMTAEVTDLACRTAERAVHEGDARGAARAAEAGLRACPYDERLFRVLMQAHDLDGNLAGVRSTMERLCKVVEDDIEPVESVHPETQELYAQLVQRRPDRPPGRPRPPTPTSSDGVIRPFRRHRPKDA